MERLCGLRTCSQPWALSANVPDPERVGEGPCTVIPDCPLLGLAVAGWGPWEAGRKLMGWAPGEVELLCVPQGRWQLEWPSQLRPEGRALYARHCVPLDGGCSPPDRANSAPGQRVIPRESGELIAFPEAVGMRPSVAQPKLQNNDPIPLPFGQDFLHSFLR